MQNSDKILSFSRSDIEQMDRIYRLNLVNSITGFKPANLVGTISNEGRPNLTVISSVLHMSSSPAIIGFMQRPTKVPRHTYMNIKESGFYTINHIHQDFTAKAHYTSAKFPREQSEFDVAGFTEAYHGDFPAPFVRESAIKMGLSYIEEYQIKASNTILMVGQVEFIILPEEIIQEDGQLLLPEAGTAVIAGLNQYHSASRIGTYPYARPGGFPFTSEEK